MDAARLWLVVWTRFLVSQRTDPRRFFSLFFFHRFSSVLIAPFAFAALLWEWEIFMKSGRASSVEKRSGTRDQNAKKYVATQDFERMAIEWFWEWLRCLEYAYSLNETVSFFLVNYFFIIKQEIWIINFGNIMLLIEIKKKKFWNDW